MKQGALIILMTIGIVACAAPRPVLYPNAHFKEVGKEAAEQDIATCKQMAETAGATPEKGKGGQVAGSTAVGGGVGAASGAVGGAVVGRPGVGAAVGAAGGATAGFLRGIFSKPKPSQAYVNFVNRCLSERGYEPVGWE